MTRRTRTKIVAPQGFRRFDSRYGWDHPAGGAWQGWTLGIRVSFLVVLVWSVLGCPTPW